MQGAVGLPIPAAGQTMASGLAAGCWDVRRAAQCGECGLGADPVGVLAGRDEQLGGGLVADTRLLRSNPGVPAGDVSIMKSPATRWARATSRVQIAEPRPKLESLAIAMGSASSSNGMATSTGRKFSCRTMTMSLVTSAKTYRGRFRGWSAAILASGSRSIARLMILPVEPFGSSSTNCTTRGIL